MKITTLFKIVLTWVVSLLTAYPAYPQGKDTALLIIDIQNFYFPGGDAELVNPEKASENAALVLQYFRAHHMPIVHIRHNYDPGGEIHESVFPLANEKVISKDHANGFLQTDLLDYLNSIGITTLVITGMQTHMCVEATVRAGADFGFNCIVISDACATRDLTFDGHTVKSDDVQYSTLSALKSGYAKVMTSREFIRPGP